MQMDETFATALRDLLVEQVESSSSSPTHRSGRRWRWSTGLGALLSLVAGGAGIAYATGAFSTLPGGDRVTELAAPVTATGIGTQTVRLGTPPAGSTGIDINFTCLTAGRFAFADGARVDCASASTRPATYTLALKPGQDTTTITANPGARWRLVATYAKVTTTKWALNASGQTYGVANQHGTPELVAVIATNGRSGYVYAKQLMWGPSGEPPTSPAQAIAESGRSYTLTVYESDGKTPIGKFMIGG